MEPFNKEKQLVVFFTGFGKFGPVLSNPTTKLSEACAKLLEDLKDPQIVLKKNYIITVACEDCDEALAEIYEQVEKLVSDPENYNQYYLVLHFGVYQGCGAFNLENIGKNVKDFRIPDERGSCPRNECINTDKDISHTIQTCLDLS